MKQAAAQRITEPQWTTTNYCSCKVDHVPKEVHCNQATLVRFTFTKLYAVDRLLTAEMMVARIWK